MSFVEQEIVSHLSEQVELGIVRLMCDEAAITAGSEPLDGNANR